MALGGCKGVPLPVGPVSGHEAGLVETARAQMELIPPPSKNRYMAVHNLSAWENPYLTAQGEMVTLHVLLADANTSGMGEGTLLRPVGARRQDLNVRVQDLPAAFERCAAERLALWAGGGAGGGGEYPGFGQAAGEKDDGECDGGAERSWGGGV